MRESSLKGFIVQVGETKWKDSHVDWGTNILLVYNAAHFQMK